MEPPHIGRAFRTVQILALVGGALCLVVAFGVWSIRYSLGIVTPLLLTLVMCGAAETILAAFALRTGDRSNRWRLTWTGGAAACGIVGLTTIGPIVAAALILLVPSLVVGRHHKSRGIVVSIGVFLLSCAAWTVGLLWIGTRSGVEMVPIPTNSAIRSALPGFDYADAFKIELPSSFEGDVDLVAHAVSRCMRPVWLQNPKAFLNSGSKLEPGGNLGGWPVHHRAETEIILGLNRSFIDLRLSLLLERNERSCSVTATTVARYNNWQGRVYFVPVRMGHQIVLSDTMRRVRAELGTQELVTVVASRTE
ncbi:MAG: DUF2867 domain-containing protein [Deltaproteobacteria bacterium]|nr:DUF2867 domain-containing protein [Deltaproteobacteria bacterium]